jgi:hypothetical protein
MGCACGKNGVRVSRIRGNLQHKGHIAEWQTIRIEGGTDHKLAVCPTLIHLGKRTDQPPAIDKFSYFASAAQVTEHVIYIAAFDRW